MTLQNASVPSGSVTSYSSILGQMIAQARAQRSLHQADLAADLGITQTAWSRIERGTTSITAEQLWTVANVLQRDPHELIQEADAAAKIATDNGFALVAPKEYDELVKNGVIVLMGVALGAALLRLYMKSKA